MMMLHPQSHTDGRGRGEAIIEITSGCSEGTQQGKTEIRSIAERR